MKIREQACDSNIVLSKFKFNCDECDKSIPDPLPQNLNHFMMIVGKPGSSKTTLLLNLICKRGKMYNKKFDKVYLLVGADVVRSIVPREFVHLRLSVRLRRR